MSNSVCNRTIPPLSEDVPHSPEGLQEEHRAARDDASPANPKSICPDLSSEEEQKEKDEIYKKIINQY